MPGHGALDRNSYLLDIRPYEQSDPPSRSARFIREYLLRFTDSVQRTVRTTRVLTLLTNNPTRIKRGLELKDRWEKLDLSVEIVSDVDRDFNSYALILPSFLARHTQNVQRLSSQHEKCNGYIYSYLTNIGAEYFLELPDDFITRLDQLPETHGKLTAMTDEQGVFMEGLFRTFDTSDPWKLISRDFLSGIRILDGLSWLRLCPESQQIPIWIERACRVLRIRFIKLDASTGESDYIEGEGEKSIGLVTGIDKLRLKDKAELIRETLSLETYASLIVISDKLPSGKELPERWNVIDIPNCSSFASSQPSKTFSSDWLQYDTRLRDLLLLFQLHEAHGIDLRHELARNVVEYLQQASPVRSHAQYSGIVSAADSTAEPADMKEYLYPYVWFAIDLISKAAKAGTAESAPTNKPISIPDSIDRIDIAKIIMEYQKISNLDRYIKCCRRFLEFAHWPKYSSPEDLDTYVRQMRSEFHGKNFSRKPTDRGRRLDTDDDFFIAWLESEIEPLIER